MMFSLYENYIGNMKGGLDGMKYSHKQNYIIAFKPTFDESFNSSVEKFLFNFSGYAEEAVFIEGFDVENKLLNILGYYNFDYLIEHDCEDDLLKYNKILDLYKNGYSLFEKLIDFRDDDSYYKMLSLRSENFEVFNFS